MHGLDKARLLLLVGSWVRVECAHPPGPRRSRVHVACVQGQEPPAHPLSHCRAEETCKTRPILIRMMSPLPTPPSGCHDLLRNVAKKMPITIRIVTMTQHILARACEREKRGGRVGGGGWRKGGGGIRLGRRSRREGR